MSDFDWGSTEKVDAHHDDGGFDWDQHERISPDKFNMGQAAFMHGMQGATGGFMDELQGLGEAAGRVAGVQGVGGPMKNMGMAKGGPTVDWETLRDAYTAARDHERESLKEQSKEHPVASTVGNIAGMVVSPLNKIAKGMTLAKGGAVLGGINGLGNSEADDAGGMAIDTAMGTGAGLVLGAGADKLSSMGSKAAAYLSQAAAKKAEGLAVNATGATGLQASKFADDAGRQLLDRGFVKLGDSPANIAKRVGGAMENAGADINSSLTGLDAKGVTASADNVVAKLQARIAELEKDPSQAGAARKLRGVVDDIIQSGESNVPVSAAENTKRGFGKMAGNWMDPEVGQAGKQAYLGYMDEVERAALEADPTLAAKFTQGKDTYKLLAPIQEAAEKRAMTQQQSPWGGLGDMMAMATGSIAKGDPTGGIGGVVGKKMLAPRLTSTAAVTLDKVSKALMGSPRMAALAQRNPQAFSALATSMAERMGGGVSKAASSERNQPEFVSKPTGEQDAKSSFLEGN